MSEIRNRMLCRHRRSIQRGCRHGVQIAGVLSYEHYIPLHPFRLGVSNKLLQQKLHFNYKIYILNLSSTFLKVVLRFLSYAKTKNIAFCACP